MAGQNRKLRTRRVRHRNFAGLTRGSAGLKRLHRLFATNSRLDSKFAGTAAATTVSGVDSGADELTATGHGLRTGMPIVLRDPGAGTAPAPLAFDTSYAAIVVDANTIQVAADAKNALLLNAINITGGTVTANLERWESDPQEWVQGKAASDQLEAETDIDAVV